MTAERRAGLLAFLTAFVTLFVQILVHRMVSAKLLNNYAFLVISLTMLGFASSAVVLTQRRQHLSDIGRVFPWSAVAFALTLLGASVLFYRAPSPDRVIFGRVDLVWQLLSVLPWALLFAAPFFFCGLILGVLLSDPRLPTRRVYFYDLLGSAAGAVAVIPAINALGVERSALGAAFILVVGALVVPEARRGRAAAALAASAAVVVVAAGFPDSVFAMRYPERSLLGATQVKDSGYVLESVYWDPIARIEVTRTPPPDPETFTWPALIGSDRAFLTRFRRMLTQNNNAFTYAVEYDGDPGSLAGIEETIYAAAYQSTSVARPRVLTVGVGGGFDVLTALRMGAAQVTGVEVNGATLAILRRHYHEYFKSWTQDPRVRLVHDEGRHFLAVQNELFDIVQLSGVDSVSGTPAAAHVFSENYLYAAEAFDLYLSRLTEQGILNVMRPEHDPPREMLRVLVTAVAALRRAGVSRPADHLAVLASKSANFTALLLKRTPFTAEEVGRLQAWSARSPFFFLAAAPGVTGPGNLYQGFLALQDQGRERTFAAIYPFDVEPIDDDRPFFFRFSRWSHLWSDDPAARVSLPLMELSLIVLLAITSLAAAFCVFLPLRHLAREAALKPGAARLVFYFACLGLGYLGIEMALLQKFGLLLGHPNHALSVVLAALLFTTGVGSLLAQPIVRALGNLRFVAYLLAAVVLVEYSLVFPLLPDLLTWSLASRVVVVVLLVAPIGLCLGTFFPWVVDRMKESSPALVPWTWGVNGIFSVAAPIPSVAVSMTYGIGALILSALPLYVLGTMALPSPLGDASSDPEEAEAPG